MIALAGGAYANTKTGAAPETEAQCRARIDAEQRDRAYAACMRDPQQNPIRCEHNAPPLPDATYAERRADCIEPRTGNGSG